MQKKKKTDEFPLKWELHIKQFPGKNEMKKTKQKQKTNNCASPVSLKQKSEQKYAWPSIHINHGSIAFMLHIYNIIIK